MLDRLCPIKSLSTNVVSSERGFARELVGHLFKDDASEAIFKLVYCQDGDCTAGSVVQVDVTASIAFASSGLGMSTQSAVVVDKCAASGFPCGIAACTFASASFGLIQVSGVNYDVIEGTSRVTVGAPVVAAATAGYAAGADLTTASHAARIIGIAMASASDSAAAMVLFVKGIL